MRAALYLRLQNVLIDKAGAKRKESTLREKIAFYVKSIFSIRKNPLFSGQKRLLVFGSPRRLLQQDGHWWDIYTDYILDEIDVSYVSVEESMWLDHRKPAKTKNLKHLDILETLIFLGGRLGFAKMEFSPEEVAILRKISSEIKKRFGVEIDIKAHARTLLYRRKVKKPFYRLMLRAIKPEVVVLAVSYGKEEFIETCKDFHIPVAEVQHGVISNYHPGYSYPGETRKKKTFPDFLLLFGDYWKGRADYPIEQRGVVSVGFPHMEHMISKYSTVSKRKQVLVLSQPILGKAMSKFALELSQIEGFDYEVLYKLHPREYKGWRAKYEHLDNTNIRVIDSQGPVLHPLLAQSVAQVGVSSTAIYEGLGFGLKTFIIDMPSWEYFHDLIEQDVVTLVSEPREIVSELTEKTENMKIESNHIFRKNSVANISQFLREILERMPNWIQ
jgi:hypothetical protein